MGNNFVLANLTENEYITFLGYSKEFEIFCNKIPSQMVSYYLFEHNGSDIVFVGDQWNVGSVWVNFEALISEYKDVTGEILKEMLEEKIITKEDLDRFCPSWEKRYIMGQM